MLKTVFSAGFAPLLLAAFGLLATPAAAQPMLAFPGADGAAANVTGGRGGVVYHVTKLDKNFNDVGPGTLRYGMNDANFGGQPRTIVFDVAGAFWLGRYGAERGHDNGWDTQSRLNLGSNVTIAGQTAPGPVYIMGGVVKAVGDNTILRNVTIAPGYGLRNFSKPDEGVEPTPGDFPDSYTYDAIDISGTNQMFDHVTTVYATDETISANELADSITIQYTTIAQAQNYPQADAEGGGRFTGHALGALLQAGSNAKISVINNLYAHLKGRLPRVGSEVGSGALNDFRNNVFYNWFGGALDGGPSSQPSKNNFIENFYLAGPGGEDVSGPTLVNRGGGTSVGSAGSQASLFRSGNVLDSNKDGDALDAVAVTYGGSHAKPSQAFDIGIGVTIDAAQAYDNVLDHVGANWWNRGLVDNRLVDEVRNGTGRIIGWADDPFDDSPMEGTEWRALLSYRADPTSGAAPFSRGPSWDEEVGGGDGMPSWWEREHGLDPFSADNNGDFDADGYTNLEEYLNELAAWPAPGVIVFDGSASSRYAQIQNWKVSGVLLPIQGIGTQPTASNWQPSRYDTVRVDGSVVVDAVGQHAGSLQVAGGASLTVTDGWLKVAESVQIDDGATLRVEGGELQTSLLSRSAVGEAQFTGGTLRADGVDFDLLVEGSILAPGFQTDELIIDGSLTIGSGGLEVSISPTDGATAAFVMGDATLGGDLLVSLGEFTPAPTDEFLVLSAASISGEFDNAVGGRLGVDGGGSFRVNVQATTLVLDDYLAALAGDFNYDGVVDAADYTVWRDGLGTSHTEADYSLWAANYGASSAAVGATVTSTPEPAGVIALLGAVLLTSACRNGRGDRVG